MGTVVKSRRDVVPDRPLRTGASMESELEGVVTITIPRALLPTAPPATVTLANCHAVFGLTDEQFRRLAKKGAFPVRREKGLVIAMYDDVRAYFARTVQLRTARVRRTSPKTEAGALEAILRESGISVRKPGHE